MSAIHFLVGDAQTAFDVAAVARELRLGIAIHPDIARLLEATAADPHGCAFLGLPPAVPEGLRAIAAVSGCGDAPVLAYGPAGSLSVAAAAVRAGAAMVLDLPLVGADLRLALEAAVASSRSRTEERERIGREAARFDSIPAVPRSVLGLLLDGHSNKAVSIRLDLGLRTVERARSVALRHLGVSTLVEAARIRSRTELGRGTARCDRVRSPIHSG